MKSITHLTHVIAACLVAIVLGAFAPSAQAQTTTFSALTYSNWNTPGNWSTGSVPTTTDTVGISSSTTASYSVGLDTDATIAGLVFGNPTGASASLTLLSGTYATPGNSTITNTNTSHVLSIGSGGITISEGTVGSGGTMTIGNANATGMLTVQVTADQTWTSNGNVNDGNLSINANLAGSSAITWTGTTGGTLLFNGGSSTGFTGSFTVNGGQVTLNGTPELNRFGSSLTLRNSGTSQPKLSIKNLTGSGSISTMSVPIILDVQANGTSGPQFNVFNSSGAINGSALVLTGTLTGTISGATAKPVEFTTNSAKATDFMFRLQGDGSGLVSDKVGGTITNSAIWIHEGAVEVDNNNALGSGNVLSVSLGGNNKNTVNFGGLYLANGVTYQGAVVVNANQGGTPKASSSGYLGVLTTGSTVTYTGTLTNEINQLSGIPNTHLTAATSSKLIMNGAIVDSTTTNTYPQAPGGVSVEGGGSVVLGAGNNTYGGNTLVRDGTTLYVNGGTATSTSSGEGTGSLYVGKASTSFTGTGAASTYSIAVTSTAGLAVGQTVTGSGIVAGTTITYITSNSIQLSATTSGSVSSLSVSATTGVLSGNGRLRPGAFTLTSASPVTTQNFISVASGSVVAPGASAGQIGTLTLDGGGTTAPLMTMATGATFSFDLGAGNTSDQLAFWNYASGDLVLNTNTISFTNAQAGTYTLFTFYSDNGTTTASSGISSGLALDTASLGSYTGTLHYNLNSITLDVVPEPSTFALMLGCLGAGAMVMRRRKRFSRA